MSAHAHSGLGSLPKDHDLGSTLLVEQLLPLEESPEWWRKDLSDVDTPADVPLSDTVRQKNPTPDLQQLAQQGHTIQPSQDERHQEEASMSDDVGAGTGNLPLFPDSVVELQDAEVEGPVIIDNRSWQYKGFQEWINKEMQNYRDGISKLEKFTSNLKYTQISKRKLLTSAPDECALHAYIVDKRIDASKNGKQVSEKEQNTGKKRKQVESGQAEEDSSESNGSSAPEPSTINMPSAKSARSFSSFPSPLVI